MYHHQETVDYRRTSESSLKLVDMVEPTHKLRRLAVLVNWKLLADVYKDHFKAGAAPTPRMVFALLYLQAMDDLSSEELMEQWLVTPEWQYFCGETEQQTTYPLHPSVLNIWKRELGVNGAKLMCAALSASFVDSSSH